MAATGWTWDYVEAELDLPRLVALTKYWADHPPVHVLVAAYLGIKPKSAPDTHVNDPSELERLMAALTART